MLLQRLLLHKEKSDPIAYVIVFQGLVAILLTMYALTTGFHWPDFATLWFPILGTVVLFGGGHVLYAHTLRQVEASVFAILFATYALWVMVMGVLLFDDHSSAWSLLGTVFIFASIALLTERKGSLTIDKKVRSWVCWWVSYLALQRSVGYMLAGTPTPTPGTL
jgi:drug/metabolite transporter (DMT)-like permease